MGLSNFDFFRRVPRDLTEATKLGGCISITTVVILGVLTVLELQSLLRVTVDTKIEISHQEDEEFQVNLKFIFPSISCDWISINHMDIVGRREANLSSDTIHKHTLHGEYVASRVMSYEQPIDPIENPAAVAEVFENTRAVELSPENFETVTKAHRVVIVNFFAPWCPYCVALAPIYQEASQEVGRRIAPTHDVLFATVNCVSPQNYELCQREHIQVFPTLRVYRDGSNNPQAPHVHMHEEFRGPRTVASLSDFAVNVLKEVREARGELPAHEQVRAEERTTREYAHFGCVISGHIKVSRVPGSLVFLPIAEGHNFHTEAINMSHVVTHLSFGNHPFAGRNIPRKYRGNVPQDLGGVYADKKQDSQHATLFISRSGHITHEHYIKVVPSVFIPLRGKSVQTYEYTVNSNLYKMSEEEVPSVKLVWDIWPMEVVNVETRKPLVEGVCQMLGFLGGVFAFFMSLAWALQGFWRKLIKAQEAKLT
eukprot:RCo007869